MMVFVGAKNARRSLFLLRRCRVRQRHQAYSTTPAAAANGTVIQQQRRRSDGLPIAIMLPPSGCHQQQQSRRWKHDDAVDSTLLSSCGASILSSHQRLLPISSSHYYQHADFSTLQKAAAEEDVSPNINVTHHHPPPPRASFISKEEMHREESKRIRLSEVRITEVLKAKHSYRWVDPVIARDATVREAITVAIDGGLSGMMVLEQEAQYGDAHASAATLNAAHSSVGHEPGRRKHRVVGLLTSRDLLRILAHAIKEGEADDVIMSRPVGDYMTPLSQVIYGRPDETVGMCRTIMAKLGIKCLPILSKSGTVEGLITARDMSDFGLSADDRGGKKNYLNDVSQRTGLSSDTTSMAEPPSYLRAHLALDQSPLYVNWGHAALPHPFKSTQGGAAVRSLKELGSPDYAMSADLSEDASFVTTVTLPDEKNKPPRSFTYAGVADGVGSWREYDVDPRDFSHHLMHQAADILHEASHNDGQVDGKTFRQVIAPAELLARAYERTKAANVIGSCTACIGVFDSVRHQLHFSNLGDSGLIVLRHIDSDVAGALKRDRYKPRYERVSDLQLAFVSQQQLKSFNHPFQLGWTGRELAEGESTSFKSARDACTSSVHLRRGDLVIMATDGLFDNVDLEEICAIALKWEQDHGFIRGGDIAARTRRWQMGNSLTVLSSEKIQELADALCQRARENSLDSNTDSPFAILAKENDIMWSGGMPDDCTVVALHIVGRDAHDTMEATNQ